MPTMKWASPKSWVVAAVALLAAWLVIRTAAVAVTATAAPSTALRLAPGNPVALIAASTYRTRAPHPPSAREMAQLQQAAQGDPLYPEPYLAKAALVSAQGDPARAIRLAEIARARDPRNEATHVFLLEHYARAGDIEHAVAEMAPLVSLAGGAAPALANTLAVLARSPQGERVVAQALQSNPGWRSAFIGQATPASQRLAFRTLLAAPPGVGENDRLRDQQSFLERLIEQRDYQRAYLAWINFLPRGAGARVEAIYDGSFEGLKGVPPFNWSLASNEAATAERRSDSSLPGGRALDINFFGSDAAEIASQTLFVQPGAYQFQMVALADGGGQFAGKLSWQLTCLPGGQVIPLATIDQFDGKPMKVQRPLEIPQQGCEAQRLTLAGTPGEVSTLIHAQFTGIRLVPR